MEQDYTAFGITTAVIKVYNNVISNVFKTTV